MQPFRTNLVHYNWHWIWDFGNGEIGNMGSHQLDVCRWAMPDGAAPKSVVSLGGRFGYKDQGQTPNTQLTMIDFGESKVIFELAAWSPESRKITNEFYTDEGVVRDGKFFPKGRSEGVPIADFPAAGFAEQGPRHMRNFIDCVRSRKREDLGAEILEGHRSVAAGPLGQHLLPPRQGRALQQDKPRPSATTRLSYESFEDMKRHLADAARLELTNSTYRLGRTLQFDAQAERFVGAPEADRMLTRPYRGPFVVPEEV